MHNRASWVFAPYQCRASQVIYGDKTDLVIYSIPRNTSTHTGMAIFAVCSKQCLNPQQHYRPMPSTNRLANSSTSLAVQLGSKRTSMSSLPLRAYCVDPWGRRVWCITALTSFSKLRSGPQWNGRVPQRSRLAIYMVVGRHPPQALAPGTFTAAARTWCCHLATQYLPTVQLWEGVGDVRGAPSSSCLDAVLCTSLSFQVHDTM